MRRSSDAIIDYVRRHRQLQSLRTLPQQTVTVSPIATAYSLARDSPTLRLSHSSSYVDLTAVPWGIMALPRDSTPVPAARSHLPLDPRPPSVGPLPTASFWAAGPDVADVARAEAIAAEAAAGPRDWPLSVVRRCRTPRQYASCCIEHCSGFVGDCFSNNCSCCRVTHHRNFSLALTSPMVRRARWQAVTVAVGHGSRSLQPATPLPPSPFTAKEA